MKDQRYDTIFGMLKAGAIEKFTDIFKLIPFSTVANDLHTNRVRMKKMIADPSLWKLEEVYKLADLIGCDRKKLALMGVDQVEAMKKGKN
jgi:hypothetical protein